MTLNADPWTLTLTRTLTFILILVRLYSAFYVVRSFCLEPDLHVDWPDGAGTNAFTLLTPLEDYSSSEGFHLLYEDNCKDNYEDNCEDSSEDNCEDNYEDNYEDSSAGAASSEATGQPAQLRQYRYSEGEAIVFGSRFRHSTEPGRAASGPCSPSVLLCAPARRLTIALALSLALALSPSPSPIILTLTHHPRPHPHPSSSSAPSPIILRGGCKANPGPTGPNPRVPSRA